MIESRRQTGQWRRIAPPPGSTQSTSRLFCAAESEINRIVTLGAVPGRTLPRSKPERSPRLLNEVSTGIEYRLPPGSCRVRRWPVNYRKLTVVHPGSTRARIHKVSREGLDDAWRRYPHELTRARQMNQIWSNWFAVWLRLEANRD